MSSPKLELPVWMKNYPKPSVNKTEVIQGRPKPSTALTDNERQQPESADTFVCFHFWQIAEFSEKLLLAADKGECVIGLDLDWPAGYKSVLSKTSQIHICHGINKCCVLKVSATKLLPKSLILLLKHPNVKLAGYSLSQDLVKLGKDFNFDVQPVLEKISSQLISDCQIYCCHKWNLDSTFEKVKVSGAEESLFSGKRTLFRFPGKLRYANHLATCAASAEELLELAGSYPSDNKLIIGFDLEWPFSFKSGSGKVALVQLCADKDQCYLLHIPKLNSLPKTLVLLLNHKNVKLAGVNIANDIRKIGRDFKIETSYILQNNIVELGPFANKVLGISERWSLDRLVLQLLGLELEKPVHVRCSDWSKEKLSSHQLVYAAADAYAGLAVYNHLKGIQESQKDNFS